MDYGDPLHDLAEHRRPEIAGELHLSFTFTNSFFCYREIVKLCPVPSSTDAKHATNMRTVGHSGYLISVDGRGDLLAMKFEYKPMPLVRGERHVSRGKSTGNNFVSGR